MWPVPGCREGLVTVLIHIVMFRRKPGNEPDAAVEARFFDQLGALHSQVPLIRRWRLSRNQLARPTSWSYVLESAFDDVAALDAYLVHPAHVAVVGSLRHYFDWAVCDYTARP